MIIETCGVVLAIAVLIYLSFRNVHPVIFSLFSSVVVIVTNRMNFWESISKSYATGFGNFIGAYYLLFMLGAVYGAIMRESGAARTIAERLIKIFGTKYALLATIIVTMVLSYGGVSVFVIIFALYPIALPLFREADINKELMPATIVLSSVVILLGAPGMPTLTNATLNSVLGGTIYDAPILGLIASTVMFILGYAYLFYQQKKMSAAGNGFSEASSTTGTVENRVFEKKPSLFFSALPLLVVMCTVFFTKGIMNSIDAINMALFFAIIVSIVLYWNIISPQLNKLTVDGINSSLSPIVSTASLLGFAAIVQQAPAFQVFMDSAVGLAKIFNPYVAGALAINVGSAITAAALSGMQIFTNTMMPAFMGLDFNPAAFHRIMVIAAGVLDSLPHSSTLILLATVIGVNYKRSYKHVFVCTVIVPAIGVVVGIICALNGIV